MELWDAYYADGSLANVDLIRGESIPDGLFHVVVEVFVRHTDGSFLIMQRDENKPNYPSMYETGASGSVTKGEQFIMGAMRELKEETGIESNNLQEIYHIVNHENQTIYYGYSCICDIQKDSITLQKGETISYQWLDKQSLFEMINSDLFVHDLKVRLKDTLDNL